MAAVVKARVYPLLVGCTQSLSVSEPQSAQLSSGENNRAHLTGQLWKSDVCAHVYLEQSLTSDKHPGSTGPPLVMRLGEAGTREGHLEAAKPLGGCCLIPGRHRRMGGVSGPGRPTSPLAPSHTRGLLCMGPSPCPLKVGMGLPHQWEAKLRCTISSEDGSQLAGGKSVGRREGSR